MLAPFPFLKAQFLDSNGDPLAAGKLESYDAGTATPKVTYSNPAGSAENTNPVILDAAGRAALYLSGSYKFVLKNSLDVEQWTIDNVRSEVEGSIQSIATVAALKALPVPGGDVAYETLGYYAAGDGGHGTYRWNSADATADNGGTVLSPDVAPATGRWNLIHSGRINVRQFGAKGDGITDDTAAILNLLAAAVSGGILYFPPGNYFVSPVVSVSRFVLSANQKIIGAGSATTKITCNSAVLSPQGQSLFATSVDDNRISGLTIDGGGLSTIQCLILGLSGCDRFHLEDLIVKNTAANLGAIYISDATAFSASDVYIEAFVGTLAAQTAKCHGLALIQAAKGPSYHKIHGITVLGGNFGVYVKNQQSCAFSDLLIIGPVATVADSGDGFNFSNNDHCSVNNLVITGRQDAGLVVYSDVAGQIPRYNVFSNVTSTLNTLDGVYVAAGRYNQFHNIVALNNNKGTPTYGTRYGVYVNVDSGELTQYNSFTGILAADDQAAPTQSYGLAIAAGVADCQFYDCFLEGNVTGTFTDAGTTTLITLVQDSYRLGSRRGFVIANGGDSISAYAALNESGVGKRILFVASDGIFGNGTIVQSAGGGIEFRAADGTVLGYVTDAGVWYLEIDGGLKEVSVGAIDSGGSGFKLLRVPN